MRWGVKCSPACFPLAKERQWVVLGRIQSHTERPARGSTESSILDGARVPLTVYLGFFFHAGW
jgi:hypothetical protein